MERPRPAAPKPKRTKERATPRSRAQAREALRLAPGEPLPEDLRHELRRKSLAFFMHDALGMQVGPHHFEWSEALTRHRKLALQAARGHGKSAFWSYAYPLWQMWRQANCRGLLVSNTEGQVASLMRLIKDGKAFVDEQGREWRMPPAAELPVFASVIPRNWATSWTTERIWFTNGSETNAKTFGKSFRGAHVQFIVIDDPISDNAQYSQRERDKAANFLFRTVSPMLLPARNAQMVVVGTPMHDDDLHARLSRNREYWHRKYPGRWVDKGTGEERYLWPKLRDAAWHRQAREEWGPLAYGQEVELTPVTNSTSLFPPSLFAERPETLAHHLVLRPPMADIKAMGLTTYMGVDLAVSAGAGADFFVAVVLGVDAHKNRYVLDLRREKGCPYHLQLALIQDLAARWEPTSIRIEANQAQVVWPMELRRTTDLPVVEHTTGVQKRSLRDGVPRLRTLIENGKLRIPRGSPESVDATDVLLGELRDFGWVDDRLEGQGNHDDTVMALWIADCAVRAGSRMGVDSISIEAGPSNNVLTQTVNADLEASEFATRVRAQGAPAPEVRRVNPAAHIWVQALAKAPGATVEAAAAMLPDDRSAWVEAWNDLINGGEGGAAAEVVRAYGREVATAVLRDLLG